VRCDPYLPVLVNLIDHEMAGLETHQFEVADQSANRIGKVAVCNILVAANMVARLIGKRNILVVFGGGTENRWSYFHSSDTSLQGLALGASGTNKDTALA